MGVKIFFTTVQPAALTLFKIKYNAEIWKSSTAIL